MSLFTVELRYQSGSISRIFSAAISIVERKSVRSFVFISPVPRSSSSSSSFCCSVKSWAKSWSSSVDSGWEWLSKNFSDARRTNTVKTNFFCYFAYLLDQHIRIVIICTVILAARPNFMPHIFHTRHSYFFPRHFYVINSFWNVIIFSALFQVDPISIHLSYHFLKWLAKVIHLKAATTPWPIGWSREVVLGGKKPILTSSSNIKSSKSARCPGMLSSNRRAFRGDLFWLQNCNTLWQKCLEYHSEKICYMPQAFLFEVQMTGKWDFRMPFITLGILEWYTSNCSKFRVPDAFPPRSRVSTWMPCRQAPIFLPSRYKFVTVTFSNTTLSHPC